MRHEPTRRAVEVATALAAAGEPVTTTRLAASLGASRSTLHAVLAELHACGWADRVSGAGGGWVAGPVLRAVGRSVGTEPDLARIARPALDEVADLTGIAAAALQLRGDFLEVVDVVRGGVRTSSSSSAMPTGHTIPLRAPFVRDVAARLPESRREMWLTDGAVPAAARARLDLVMPQVTRRGWSVDRLTPARRELLRMADALESSGVGPLVRDRVSELFAELSTIDVLDSELTPGADLAVFAVSAPVIGRGNVAVGSIAATPGRRMTGRAVMRTTDAVTVAAADVSARVAALTTAAPPPPARLRHA
ncbi:hypothetical protein NCCP2495_27770 [Dietzia sp. NCCP-2495]|uniref:helix-turn-helix domain-containing protein n=1 Tax=Dietzia sp. NCCP-2495 TaxID=2934675 RepID=UPI0022313456|nr:helix-turn-helix domain-containing protein [Dietzia sp. NCCP-2495]GLB64897.1 hypothetical protein NCCP2495_27770 [Dietzia sp. NCCP-2495]